MTGWSKFLSCWPLHMESSNVVGYLIGMFLAIVTSPASLALSAFAHAASRVLAKVNWLEKPALVEWSFG